MKRQYELDLAKCLSIIGMVGVHVLGLFGGNAIPGWEPLIGFWGGPLAAPVFMFCMGIGMVYTRDQSARAFLKRGGILLATGYLLNLFRYTIPALLMANGKAGEVWYGLARLGEVDILQFAGLTFLTVGLCKKLQVRKSWLMLLALLGFFLAQAVPAIETDTFWTLLGGHFVWIGNLTAFPFLLWLPIPLTGLLFGELLQKSASPKAFYGWASLVGAAAVLVSTGLSLIFRVDLSRFVTQDYYQLVPLQLLWTLGLVLIWISCLYFLMRKISRPAVLSAISGISRQLNTIYISHWLVLAYLALAMEVFRVNFTADTNAHWLILTLSVLGLALALTFARQLVRGRVPALQKI